MKSMKDLGLIVEIHKYDMSGQKIATEWSNFGFIGSHLNWGNNWSMKRKTSVMRVTKPLR